MSDVLDAVAILFMLWVLVVFGFVVVAVQWALNNPVAVFGPVAVLVGSFVLLYEVRRHRRHW